MLVVHHLDISQSEHILWLCEELEATYVLIKHTRDPIISPESLKRVPGNDTAKSPFVKDTMIKTKMSERSAIVEYIIYKYGKGGLAVKPDELNYSDWLYWSH